MERLKALTFLLVFTSTFSKTDTFETATKYPSWRDVRLMESQIKGVKKGRDSKCPFYRGVRLIEVSITRELTVHPHKLMPCPCYFTR